MDISSIAPNERVIDIVHPATEEPIGLKITLLPSSHENVKKVQRHQQNRRLQSRKFNVTAEQLEAQGLELLVAAISGWEWSGDANFEGEVPEFNAENVRRVLKKADWIRDQVDKELANDAAFFEG